MTDFCSCVLVLVLLTGLKWAVVVWCCWCSTGFFCQIWLYNCWRKSSPFSFLLSKLQITFRSVQIQVINKMRVLIVKSPTGLLLFWEARRLKGKQDNLCWRPMVQTSWSQPKQSECSLLKTYQSDHLNHLYHSFVMWQFYFFMCVYQSTLHL